MNISAKHAIWNGKQFDFEEKKIELSNRTIVKVISCGVCGTDKHTMEELDVQGISLGHEILGEVFHLGDNHNVVGGGKLEVGDKVIVVPGKNCGECFHCLSSNAQENLCGSRTAHGWGIYSEVNYFAAGGLSSHVELFDEAWVIPVPKDIPDNISVLAEPIAIAVRAVDRAISCGRPDRDLGAIVAIRAGIIGLGPIGYLVGFVLKTLGAEVHGFDPNRERCEIFSRQLGFAATQLPIEESAEIEKYIGLEPTISEFDIIFECGGTTSAFVAALKAVRKGGRVVELGNYIQLGESEIDPSWICRKELDVLGFVLANPATYLKVVKVVKNSVYRTNLPPSNTVMQLSKILSKPKRCTNKQLF